MSAPLLMHQTRQRVTEQRTVCWHLAFVLEQQHNTLNDMLLPAAGAAERKDNDMDKQPLNRALETSEVPQPMTDGVGATDARFVSESDRADRDHAPAAADAQTVRWRRMFTRHMTVAALAIYLLFALLTGLSAVTLVIIQRHPPPG